MWEWGKKPNPQTARTRKELERDSMLLPPKCLSLWSYIRCIIYVAYPILSKKASLPSCLQCVHVERLGEHLSNTVATLAVARDIWEACKNAICIKLFSVYHWPCCKHCDVLVLLLLVLRLNLRIAHKVLVLSLQNYTDAFVNLTRVFLDTLQQVTYNTRSVLDFRLHDALLNPYRSLYLTKGIVFCKLTTKSTPIEHCFRCFFWGQQTRRCYTNWTKNQNYWMDMHHGLRHGRWARADGGC